MRIIRTDAADPSGRHDDRLGALTFKKLANRKLLGEIEFVVSAQEQIRVALASQGPDHGRTHQTAMSGYVNTRRLADLHEAIRDGYKPYSPLAQSWRRVWPSRDRIPPFPPPTPKSRPPRSSRAFVGLWWHRPREFAPRWAENNANPLGSGCGP